MAANLAPSLASRATNPASVSHEGFVWEAEPQMLQTIIRRARPAAANFAPCWLSVKTCSHRISRKPAFEKKTRHV
eukprot:scaffold24438_cov63-Phaeocystis_antarctica.AAC.3